MIPRIYEYHDPSVFEFKSTGRQSDGSMEILRIIVTMRTCVNSGKSDFFYFPIINDQKKRFYVFSSAVFEESVDIVKEVRKGEVLA